MTRRTSLAALVLLATVAGGAMALAQDAQPESEKSRFVRWLEGMISTPGRQIALNGLEGTLSSNPRAASIVISDERGPWLRLDDVDIDWTRSALFRRTLDIQSIAADSVTWLRAAEKSADAVEEADDEEGFGLPVDIVIDRMSFPDVVVEEEALGAGANLALEGDLTLSEETIAGDLALQRLDRPGTFAATFRLDPDANLLSADIDLTEPAGGIFAESLDLTGRPALALSLSGEGPLDNWRGDLRVEADGMSVLDGTISVARPAEAYALNAELVGDLGGVAPAAYRALLAGESRLAIQATRHDTGAIDIASATLRSEGAEVALSGALAADLVPQRADLSARLGQAGRTGIPFAPAELSVATLTVTAGLDEGADAPWRAEIHATGLESTSGNAGALDVTATGQASNLGDADARALTFRVDGSATGVAPSDPAVTDALGRSVSLNGSGAWSGGEPIRFEALQLVLEGATASFAGTADAGSMTGRYEASTTGLARFAAIAGRPLAGSAAIRADGSVGLRGGTLDLTLAGSARELALGIPTLDPLLAGTTTISGGVSRGPDQGLRFSDLTLANGETNARLSGLYSDAAIDLAVEANVADLSAVTPRASGSANVSGTVQGTAAAPRLEVEATGTDIVLMERPLTGASARFAGIVAGPETAGEATLLASLGSVPVAGSARLAAGEAGARRIDDLDLTVGRSKVTGALVLTGDGPVTGSIDVVSPDLSEVAPLFLATASGAIDAEVTLSAKNGGQSAAVTGTARNLVYENYRATLAEISGSADDLLTAPKLDGKFSLRNVEAAGLTIIAADGTATRSGDATTIAADAELADGNATLRASLAPAPSGMDVGLETFRFTRPGADVALAAPTTIAVRNGVAAFDDATLTTGGGRLTIDGSAGETFALDLTLADVPAALVNSFAPDLAAEGAVSGTASVAGTASEPSARYDLAWSGASVAASRNVGLADLNVRANGTYGGDAVQITSRIEGGGGLGITVAGMVGTTPGGMLALDVTGAVPLSLGNQRLASRGAVLQGALDVDIEVAGTASAPRYSGTVSATGGGFIDPDTGIVLSDLNLAAAVSNNSLVIQRLTARSGEGTVSAAGSIGLEGDLPVDLTAELRQARYVDGTLVAARFDADLTMTGSLSQGPTLAGRVFIDRAEVTVPERLPGSSVVVDVGHRGTPAPVAETLRRASYGTRSDAEAGEGGASNGISLDITVDAPAQIFIRGRGLDAEVGGDLRVRGPVSAVTTDGAFEMRRGRLDLFTQRVTFSRGTVTFAGDLDPVLDFEGSTTAKDVTVTVTVSGRASDPAVVFSSTPELPQDEVLAHLLFNRGIGELSPVQIARLASAVAQMSGTSSGGGILENLRKTTGLDDLDLITDQEGEAALRAGRYVSENVYLGVEQGAAGSSSVTIDLDVTKDVKARGAFGSEGGSSLGIFYEREY